MKPRLGAALPTLEDIDAWQEMWNRSNDTRMWHALLKAAREADRRDADLMFCWLAAPENSPRYWSLYYLSGRHLE